MTNRKLVELCAGGDDFKRAPVAGCFPATNPAAPQEAQRDWDLKAPIVTGCANSDCISLAAVPLEAS